MLLGLAADIHGNIFALQKVLQEMAAVGVEELLIAGDFVGYYYYSDEVLDALASWRVHASQGNHEEMFSDWMQGQNRDEYRQRYGSSLDLSGRNLTEYQKSYLIGLPEVCEVSIDAVDFAITHATPKSNSEYLYPDTSAESLSVFDSSEKKIWIVGHTHYPAVWYRSNSVVINPGSVGQQRCRRPGAHWATFDTDNSAIVFYSTPYDTSRLQRECRIRDPHVPYLSDVLSR